MTESVKRYELYLNGKLVEQYIVPTEYREIKIGDGRIAWTREPEPVKFQGMVYTCGNCGRQYVGGPGCGLC